MSLIRGGQMEKKKKNTAPELHAFLLNALTATEGGSRCDVFHLVTVMTLRNGGGCRSFVLTQFETRYLSVV